MAVSSARYMYTITAYDNRSSHKERVARAECTFVNSNITRTRMYMARGWRAHSGQMSGMSITAMRTSDTYSTFNPNTLMFSRQSVTPQQTDEGSINMTR